MVSKPRFVDKFMHATGRLRSVFGPADRGDPTTPVVHRHDDAEVASDEQIADMEVERDAQGHIWVEDKRHED
ncbi:hypothetical protein ABIB49_003454 [Arthrobacter sp. UYCu512]